MCPASISPFVNSVPPFGMTLHPVLVTGKERYAKLVSAQEGIIRLMDRCWLQPGAVSGDKHRRAKVMLGGGLSAQLSDGPA